MAHPPDASDLRDLTPSTTESGGAVGSNEPPRSKASAVAAVGLDEADSRFELRRLLGSGGMGVVYEAYDRQREQWVALKVLRQLEPGAITRFKREFRSLARVSHPNLIRLHELLSVNERWLYTMELIDGQTLTEYVRGTTGGDSALQTGVSTRSDAPSITALITRPELTAATGDMLGQLGAAPRARPNLVKNFERLREVMGQLVIAVDALHRTGHLHRDLKPSNVLIDRSGRLVLLDFGVIAELGAQEHDVIGTPTYMAPEQFVAGSTHTTATDWYALGCVLYTLVAGTRPFAGRPSDIAFAKQNITPVPLRELFTAVPEDIDEICSTLLHRDPAARPKAADVYQALVGRTLYDATDIRSTAREASRLIGRRRHLEVLHASLQRAAQGHGTGVTIRGRSGMGKSALVRAFLDEARETRGALVFEGRCYERESVPYKGVDGIVDSLAQHLARLPQADVSTIVPKEIASLERAFPALGAVPAFLAARTVAPPVPAEPLEIRRRAFSALLDLLRSIASSRPLILVLDDLQWSDTATQPFMTALVNRELPRVMFVGCYRDDAAPNDVLTSLLTADGVEPIRVGRLSLPDAAQLAEDLLSQRGPVDFGIARQIARESGGTPFLIEELVRYSQDQPASARLNATEGLTADRVILARVESLPELARRILELVALAGRPLRRRVLAQAAKSGPAIFEILANLEDANLVSSSGTTEDDFVEPYHDRVREAVTNALPTDAATAHHLALALVMELSEYANHEDSLRHFAAAGVMDRAADHAIEAGDAAARALAFERAAHCYRLALAYHPSADRTALEVKLAEALLNSGRALDAADQFFEASIAAEGIDARTLKVRAAAEYLRGGAIDRGTILASEVMEDLGTSHASPLRTLAGLLIKRAQIRLRGYRFDPRPASKIAPELLSRIDASWRAAAVFSAVDPIRGLDVQSRHMLLSLKTGEPQRVSQALLAEATFLSLGGATFEQRSTELVEQSAAIDGDSFPDLVGWRHGVRSVISYQAGKWADAAGHAVRGVTVLSEQCSGVQWEMSTGQLFHIWSLYYLGRVGALEKHRREYLRNANERGDIYGSVSLRVGLTAMGSIAQGRTAEAREEIRWALNQWTAKGFHLQHLWAGFAKSQCDLYDGEPEEAFARMEMMYKAAIKARFLRVQALRAETHHLRGCAAIAVLARGSTTTRSARAVAIRVERLLRREQVPWITALADSIGAALHALDGRIDDAARLLRRAAHAFAELDMELFAAASYFARSQLTSERLTDEPDSFAARQQMIDLGVTEPERLVPLFVPLRIAKN